MKISEIDSHIDKSGSCWIWTGAKTPDGYGQASINHKVVFIHRFMMNNPAGVCVLHKCDNPSCVNPEHLFLGSKGDNNRDRAIKGRSNRGSDRYCSKLTEKKVLEARAKYKAGGVRLIDLANEYSVSITTIHDAIRGKRWSWLK